MARFASAERTGRVKVPPALATRILHATVNNAALAGDLREVYQSGRSRWWYWRQVIIAVAVESSVQTRRHPVISVRALVMGWGFLVLFTKYVALPLVFLDEWLFVTGLADLRWHWPDHRPLVFLVICIGCLLGGWAVARLHPRSFVLVFAASIVTWHLLIFPRVLYAFMAHPSSYSLPMLVVQAIIAIIIMPICVVVGGLFHQAKSHDLPASEVRLGSET
jgi:hypothetical protein